MEKYIIFAVPIKRECDNGEIVTHKLKFIDSFRFMSTSLSELVDNMSGIFNSIECKSCTTSSQSNFKKIALAPHDYVGNFYLI